MSSSRSAIDDALSPDDLGDLSRIMFPEEPSRASDEETPPPTQDGVSEERVEAGEGPGTRAEGAEESELDAVEADSRGTQGESRIPPGPTGQSRATSEGPKTRPHGSNPGGANAKRAKSRRRETERPTFTIFADQMATLRVVGSSRRDPLGASASKIARGLFDLFGYNGRHPAAALHGQTLSERSHAPGPLIEERQWKDLLAAADQMVARSTTAPRATPADQSVGAGSSEEESPGKDELIDGDEARMVCLCFLVQEALYEAGFGDGRQRRKGPF